MLRGAMNAPARFFITVLMGVTLTATTLAAPIAQLPDAQTRLIDDIITRLEISKDVAWTKFRSHLPVVNPQREAVIMKGLISQGEKIGLTRNEVTSFFRPQVFASCLLQEEMIEAWKAGILQPKNPPKDLQKEIRPRMVAISLKMLVDLKALPPSSFKNSFRQEADQRIQAMGFTKKVASTASSPLVNPR